MKLLHLVDTEQTPCAWSPVPLRSSQVQRLAWLFLLFLTHSLSAPLFSLPLFHLLKLHSVFSSFLFWDIPNLAPKNSFGWHIGPRLGSSTSFQVSWVLLQFQVTEGQGGIR